jgi:hypothetical protein
MVAQLTLRLMLIHASGAIGKEVFAWMQSDLQTTDFF